MLTVTEKRGCDPSLSEVGGFNHRTLSALRKDGDRSDPAVTVSLPQCFSPLHPPNFFFFLLGVNMGHIVFCLPLPCPGGCVCVSVAGSRDEARVVGAAQPAVPEMRRNRRQTPLALADHRPTSQSVHLTRPPSSPKSHSVNCVCCYFRETI